MAIMAQSDDPAAKARKESYRNRDTEDLYDYSTDSTLQEQ
jgi:hypothetical protein